MRRQPTISTIIFFIACHFIATAATAQYDCTIKNFNTESGMLQNEVTAMSMDKDGYLWLGTRSGLMRYDGSGFKTFLSAKKYNNFLSVDILYAMYIHADKKLVIKTRAGDTYSIENGKPVQFSDSSTADFNASTIMAGSFPSFSLYKQLYRSILPLFDAKAVEFGYVNLLPLNGHDFILGSQFYNKFLYFNNAKLQKTIVGRHANPKKIISSKGFHFLMYNQNDFEVYDSDAFRFKKISIDWNSIKSKDADISESIFYSDFYSGEAFCFYNSVFYLLRFDADQGLIKFIPQFSIKEKTHFWSDIIYDSTNSTFFLGTPNEGFFQVKLKKIQTFNLIERVKGQLKANNIITYAALSTSDSTVVVPNGVQFTVASSGIKISALGNLFSESMTIGLLKNNSIVCTQNKSIYYYTPLDNYLVRHDFNDSFNRHSKGGQILSLCPEGDSVWVSCRNALYCVNSKSFRILFEPKPSKELVIAEYKSLHLFFRLNKDEAFVSGENELYRLQTTAPYSMEPVPEMAGKFVRHIYRYKEFLILSAYRDGLYVLTKNHFYKVPLSKELPELNSCHSTYIDKSGNIWVPTDKGLFKSTASSVIESALTGGPEPFFFYYGKANGIDNTEFNGSGVPSYAIAKNERLFYPSMGGIVSFRPSDLDEKIINTPAIIDEILDDNKEIELHSDSVHLQPGINFLAINFSTPNFGDAKNLVLEYQLDSTEWKKIQLADHQRITLLNIASGNHRLIIRKRTGFGSGDYVYKMLAIYKEKSIYERVWFYPLVILLLISMIWLFLQLKTQSLVRKKAQLQRLVEEQTVELSRSAEVKDLLISIITHDMITPLRHVGLVAEILEKDLEKDPQKIKSALADIKSTSQKILSGSRSIINWMKYNIKKIQLEKKSINLYGFINETLDVLVPIAKSKGIEIYNEVPKSCFVEVDYNIFVTVLNNLISNAVKYTDAGNIKIQLTDAENGLPVVLTISDTGKGMNEISLLVIREVLNGNLQAIKSTDKINTGLGYVMISELAKIHGLTVTVESAQGRGTKVSVTIP